MSRVEVSGLRKAFGAKQVLDGVDLQVDDGEVMAVLGPSGCGKTTLLRIIAGFLEPDAGEISFDGTVVARVGAGVPAWERRIGYVPQEGALFPHLDVRHNILFGLPRRERTDAVLREMLELAELPDDLAGCYPRELSGGQQQRVALARALAPRPRVVLLDEPFSSLDAALRVNAGRQVTRVLRNAGTTALLVTHDQGEALSLADRVAVLDEGVLAQVATPGELYGAPRTVRVGTFVGDANLVPGVLADDTAKCALGVVALRTRPVTPEGSTVTLLVRPEQLRLSSPEPGGSTGRVVEVTFYGAQVSVRVALPDGTSLLARVDAAGVPVVGDEVGLHVVGAAGVYP